MFSAADVPVNYPIAQHCEMSFLKSPPRQLYFGCLKESVSGGGETSSTPCSSNKIRYSQDRLSTYTFQSWFDVGAMLPWTQLFATSDRNEVEQICHEEGAPQPRWIGDNEDTFFQQWEDEPTQLHPITNDRVWFNHAQVFHWSTFPAELWFSFCRLGDIRFLIRCIFMWIVVVIKYRLLGYRMALDVRFGDGTPISVHEMNQVRKAIHNNLVFSSWQRGDILCIDNFRCSHGRQPTYDFGRKILVAWSNPFDKTSVSSLSVEAVSEKVVTDQMRELVKSCSDNVNMTSVPGAIDATPDTSPESTLSRGGAQELKELFISEILPAFPNHKRHVSGPIPTFH
eukprot:g3503.t1 g3503   contig12:2202300-2203580(-)